MPLSKQLTEKQIKKLEEEFLELDEDGDGTITVDEIGKILRSMKKALKVNESEIKRVLADIDKDGAWLTGGGSLLKQMDKKIAEELGIPINNTDDPLSSVVIGSGICLERFQDYKSVLKLSPKPN